ncbi:hypothetical protein CEXT_60081 [Caerostris extrusa]|uniref:Uncharacterized protein n=1 Tax=Caerostris extrusa TaxID=172846 RepID=A0AAV4NS04_CAEEX|nr:hypothetical protein CEXT_60081 [Caerostris extrusa]
MRSSQHRWKLLHPWCHIDHCLFLSPECTPFLSPVTKAKGKKASAPEFSTAHYHDSVNLKVNDLVFGAT